MSERFDDTEYFQEEFKTQDELVEFVMDYLENDIEILAVVNTSVKNKIINKLANLESPYNIEISNRDEVNEYDSYFIEKHINLNEEIQIVIENSYVYNEYLEDDVLRISNGDKVVLIQLGSILDGEDIDKVLSDDNEEVVFMNLNENYNESECDGNCDNCKLHNENKNYDFKDDLEKMTLSERYKIAKEKEFNIQEDENFFVNNDIDNEDYNITDMKVDKKAMEKVLTDFDEAETRAEQIEILTGLVLGFYKLGLRQSALNTISKADQLLNILDEQLGL